jgi:hypothetical protein
MTEAKKRANRKFYKLHRAERNAESLRQYYLHRQERSEKYRIYYTTHREEILAQRKAYYNAHKAFINALRRRKPYKDGLAVVSEASQMAKEKAHEAVREAVNNGLLIKPYSCERCGTIARLNAHHINYSNPLDVIWLCCKCHNAVHGNARRRGR